MSERDEYIQRCFRGQYPELYNHAAVESPDIPSDLRYGPGTSEAGSVVEIPQEDVGRPDAVALPGASMVDAELALAGSLVAKTSPASIEALINDWI